MKFKILSTVLLSSALLLTACGQNNDKKDERKTKEEHKKTTETKKKTDKKNKSKENNNSNLKASSNNQEEISQTPQINLATITDRGTLESVINGNYTEEQKIQAYNSAVANGVIPQGNVMEGPASAAYQSSLRVENGQEESIYGSNNQKRDYDNNGVYRTEQEQKAHEDWINDQNEWNNQQKAREQYFQTLKL